MFKHAIHGVTVSSVLDKRRSNANGDYPVRILVNFQREKKYYTTGKMCSEEVWDKMPTTKTKEIIDLRNEIHIVFDLIKNHVLELLTNDKFSLLNLDASLRVSTGKSLVELFEQRIAKLKKATQIGTMESYRSTLANIKRYKGNIITSSALSSTRTEIVPSVNSMPKKRAFNALKRCSSSANCRRFFSACALFLSASLSILSRCTCACRFAT